ncbi:MAG: SDR family NAD(P)-dependent oxidoreductase [Chloroflexota bacterium]
MAELLRGKVTIVTGASVGLGRAIAVALGQEGASVVVNFSRSHSDAEQTVRLVQAAGGEAVTIQADVASDSAVRLMVANTLDRFGRIDVLVNNAGITKHVPFSDLEGLTEEEWDRILAVDLKSVFLCSRAVVEPMRRQGGGRIINISSMSGVKVEGSSLAYCAAKAGVLHLTKCLAKTLGPEILVTALAPGAIGETRWNVGNVGVTDIPAKQERQARNSVLKRLSTPAEIADVVLFLATRGDFITGATILVDGGGTLV